MFRVVNQDVEGDNVHDDRAEKQQADVAQARNHYDQATGEFENFHELHIARRDERRHKVCGRRAFGHGWNFDEVEQDRDARRQEAKSQQDARDARKIFFHTQ